MELLRYTLKVDKRTRVQRIMHKEKVFSKEGSYELCVRSNALMHKESIDLNYAALRDIVPELYAKHGVIKVLDLACGAMPISLMGALSQFPDNKFEYTGIDINPDQIDKLQHYDFPSNITRVTTIAETAWELEFLSETDEFDDRYHLIFTGFNLHHGTPEELAFLALEIKQRLSNDGLFLNIDAYRPETEIYTRRPDVNPENPSESYRMIPTERLSHRYEFMAKEQKLTDYPSWKLDMCQELTNIMTKAGGDESKINEVINHSMKRDFPVALSEMKMIFEEAGLKATTLPLHNKYPDNPIAEYFGTLVARRK